MKCKDVLKRKNLKTNSLPHFLAKDFLLLTLPGFAWRTFI